MSIFRIEVRDKTGEISHSRLAKQAREYLHLDVDAIEAQNLFFVEAEYTPSQAEDLFTQVFVDPVLQEGVWCKDQLIQFAQGFRTTDDLAGNAATPAAPAFVCEIRFLPGVTDNVAHSAQEAFSLLTSLKDTGSSAAAANGPVVSSGSILLLYGKLNHEQAELVAYELVANRLLHSVEVKAWAEYNKPERFEQAKMPKVQLNDPIAVQEIDLHISDEQLVQLSQKNCWALTLDELHVVRAHFANEEVKAKRIAEGLPENPTDVEVEVIAQTWSEHCKHKIFNAAIEYREEFRSDAYPALGTQAISSLFKDKIRKATVDVQEMRELDWLISVFTDNAGIVRFDKNIDLCIKAETHNSPSALDPYGGALTGIVGVNRDILGCGLGARPIANTDVFCFASPEWPDIADKQALPVGLKHPRRIFDGVHLGVEHGGNKSGIPTVNGAIVFHENYAGKPLVFCGTIGAMPQTTPSGIPTKTKGQKPGDHVVMVGGRIGKDGIHGATFSSMELDEGAPATVVQIGDPITQKRVTDFLLAAFEAELYSSITDNGAGGLSSSIGEMAELTKGATIDVAKAPAKYPGLQPFELTVSESQERMSFSVPPEKLDAFLALAKQFNVEATDLGTFCDDGFFRVQYEGKTVALLDMQFLHDGLPKMQLQANWQGPQEGKLWATGVERDSLGIEEANDVDIIYDAAMRVLGSWNVRSKEKWVRRYDHEVQAATVSKPFMGQNNGPSDAAVIWLAPHGGEEFNGVTVSCGLVPRMSYYDAYTMAQHSLDEAVRNTVAVGGDPDQVCVLDNFCWPDPIRTEANPDGDHKLAQLVRACSGLYDLAMIYGTPFVSGKDSMKNDFKGKMPNGDAVKISVPPTLLVTAMARVPDVRKILSSAFQTNGAKIYLLGQQTDNMAATELAGLFQLDGFQDRPALVDGATNLQLYRKLYRAIQKDMLESCHDCSDGGVLVSLVESCIGGNTGASVGFDGSLTAVEHLFNEASGRFLVSVPAAAAADFEEEFTEATYLGEVTSEPDVRIHHQADLVFSEKVSVLEKQWRQNEQH